MKVFSWFFVFLSIVFSWETVFAQNVTWVKGVKELKNYSNILVETPTELLPYTEKSAPSNGDFLGSIVGYMIVLASVLAVIFVTWAAISMLLAHGDESKFKKAKETLIYAIVGVAIAGFAYTIVKIVSNLSL